MYVKQDGKIDFIILSLISHENFYYFSRLTTTNKMQNTEIILSLYYKTGQKLTLVCS